MENFAAQAVIAIENARLLNELRGVAGAADRQCRECSEVISRAAFDLHAVLRYAGRITLLALCEARSVDIIIAQKERVARQRRVYGCKLESKNHVGDSPSA